MQEVLGYIQNVITQYRFFHKFCEEFGHRLCYFPLFEKCFRSINDGVIDISRQLQNASEREDG